MKRLGIDYERFVTTWQRAESLPDFLELFGELSSQQAISAAHYLRKRGVSLKNMPRGGRRKPKDWSSLKALALKTKGAK